MRRILVVSSADLGAEFGKTVLWGSSVERVHCPSPDQGFDVARQLMPSLILVDGSEPAGAAALIQKLRGEGGVRRASVLVLSRSPSLADEEEFRAAGANLVLAGELDPALWDAKLEELLNVPRRRDVRIPVRFAVWSRFDPDATPVEALCLNLSVRGMLLETEEPLDWGTKLDLDFSLPGDGEVLKVVGQVVREAPAPEGRARSGVEFLIFRGDSRERIGAFVASEAKV
jgi:CheY-like chemotaxis protein